MRAISSAFLLPIANRNHQLLPGRANGAIEQSQRGPMAWISQAIYGWPRGFQLPGDARDVLILEGRPDDQGRLGFSVGQDVVDVLAPAGAARLGYVESVRDARQDHA